MKVGAFGKLILLGEHAVVYGHPALAGALSGGAAVEAVPGRGALRVPAWGLEVDAASDGPEMARAYRALRAALGLAATSPVDLVVEFAVPTGAGLGSSAAMAVAVARALDRAHGLRASEDQIAAAALASETVIHGRPSGLDHTVAQRGGFGVFRRASGLEVVRAAQPVKLVVGHTGRARDTKGRVARVGELYAERGEEVRARFSAIEALVELGRAAVERGGHALRELGAAMRENQRHLVALEVSCPEIDRMCALADDAGALGAKLTGGGGGGCVIALAPEREAAVAAAWRRAGFESFFATVGEAGATAQGRAA
jgi:mevalonate kinase